MSRLLKALSRASPVTREAAMLNHMCACTKSFGTPWSLKQLTPRMDCLPAQPPGDTSEALSSDNDEHLVHVRKVTMTDPVEH